MTPASPPRWAEDILKTILGREHGETHPGALIEQYRDSVYSWRVQSRADWSFIREVGGVAWRATWVWAAAFTAVWLGREALDWFVPTTDFLLRSMILTYSAHRSVHSAGLLAGVAHS